MPKPLTKVVFWKARAQPGKRVIPPHLKLAILSRGHILLPPRNVDWMVGRAQQSGATWPDKLTADLSHIFAEVPVTIELFLNRRLSMTNADIDRTIQAYLSLRHAKHSRSCYLGMFDWATHERGELNFGKLLDVDLALLYKRPNVRIGPTDGRLYLLVVYVCLPAKVAPFLARVLPGPPPPSPTMPPLEGVTSMSAEMNLRTHPSIDPSSTILGQQKGHSIPVVVLDKEMVLEKDKEKRLWYKIRLQKNLQVKAPAKDIVLGTECWVRAGGLEYVAAPWTLFRHQLIQFENANAHLRLDDRITKLRQWSESEALQADGVIGSRPGKEYQNTRSFTGGEWQIALDYETVRTPDGRIVELKHLLSGLDVLQRSKDKRVKVYPPVPMIGLGQPFAGFDIGSNYGAVTWSGDLGAAAAEMSLRLGKEWEARNPNATYAERADYYFTTRAGEFDLLADVDVWGIHSLRTPKLASTFSTIDSLLAFYYERTTPGTGTPGTPAALTIGRRRALELFLENYGFTYERAAHLDKYPVFQKQWKPLQNMADDVFQFGQAHMLYRTRNADKPPDDQDVLTMMELFFYWLELETIRNEAEVAGPKP